jgi:hypothetical protein
MEKRIERIKAHSSAVYRKDSPLWKPLGFSYCCPHLHCADGAVHRHPTRKREGWLGSGRGSKRKRSSLGLGVSFFLLIDSQLVWKEEKANDTHTHREKRENIRHSRPMLPGWAHTLSNSAFLTHISFSIFCGRLAAAAYCVYRSHVCGCCCLRALVTGPTAN